VALTLATLRARTKQALGGTAITSEVDETWYNERVNQGYRRLCTFQGQVSRPGVKQPQFRILRFMALESTSDQLLATGMSSNFVTPGEGQSLVYMVTDLYDVTNRRPMRRISRRKMQRLDPTETGMPRLWVPAGNSGGVGYRIYPTPSTTSEEVTVREYTYKYPAAMTSDSESPVIPDEWHHAIWMAAASDGALILDWTAKYQELEQRFLGFISERKSQYEEASFAGGPGHFNIRV